MGRGGGEAVYKTRSRREGDRSVPNYMARQTFKARNSYFQEPIKERETPFILGVGSKASCTPAKSQYVAPSFDLHMCTVLKLSFLHRETNR
jgi:hypothetical protein